MPVFQVEASVRGHAQAVIALAHLLEHLECSPVVVDPDQYRVVVARLEEALAQALPADVLDAILGAHPAAATVYENMHYAQAGLSRSTLQRSVESEQAATALLARIAHASRNPASS